MKKKSTVLCVKSRIYHKLPSSRPVYYSILELIVKRSQYIGIKFTLHKLSENPREWYKPKQSTVRDFTVIYYKVPSSILSLLVALPRIFKRPMEGKFDAYLL